MNTIDKDPSSVASSKDVRVYTKLKFVYSKKTGFPVSFVTQDPTTGRISGVREETECLKKVCIVDRSLQGRVMMNVLYDCTIIPIPNKKYYIVIDAKPTLFNAVVSSSYVKNTIYSVSVKFGNKTILFDPFNGKKESVRCFDTCKKILEDRVDIKDKELVIKDFEEAADMTLKLMERDKCYLNGLCGGQKRE